MWQRLSVGESWQGWRCEDCQADAKARAGRQRLWPQLPTLRCRRWRRHMQPAGPVDSPAGLCCLQSKGVGSYVGEGEVFGRPVVGIVPLGVAGLKPQPACLAGSVNQRNPTKGSAASGPRHGPSKVHISNQSNRRCFSLLCCASLLWVHCGTRSHTWRDAACSSDEE